MTAKVQNMFCAAVSCFIKYFRMSADDCSLTLVTYHFFSSTVEYSRKAIYFFVPFLNVQDPVDAIGGNLLITGK